MTTITLNDSAGSAKTFPAPTSVSAYPDPALGVFAPADGTPVVQRSASRGSTGDLAGTRTLSWNALPDTAPDGYTFTGTVGVLKALEGVATVLNLGSCWGSLYSSNTDITVLAVRLEPIGQAASRRWYRVTVEFVEI